MSEKTHRVCYACGKRAVDTCPLCDSHVCALCAEDEGSSCCDDARARKGLLSPEIENHG